MRQSQRELGIAMNRLFLAAIAGVALASSGPANAADLPRPAAVYKAPVVAAFSWTGCYFGGNGGWIRNDSELTTYPSGAYLSVLSAAQLAASTYSYSGSKSDFTAGVQYGCNKQYGQWVLGLDSDFNWSGISESFNASHPANVALLLPPYTEALTQKLEWFSTTRARLGWAQDRWMIYAAGGLASADVKSSYLATFGPTTYSGSESKGRYGWTVGGGVEYALDQNWFLRGEYLYIDLGKYSYTNLQGSPPSSVLTWGTDVDTRAHIARAALTYRITTASSWLEWAWGGFKY
jgi:outer membrane immunogenic protein